MGDQGHAAAPRLHQEATREARELAREAREAAREKREIYAHEAAKVNAVRLPLIVATGILYAVVIGFTLQSRVSHFSGADHVPPPHTFDVQLFRSTVGSFMLYSSVHIVLLLSVQIVVPGGLRLRPPFSWATPMILLWVGFTYLFTYCSLSRFGTHWSDWTAAGGFSFGLLIVTVSAIRFQDSLSKIV